MKKKFISIVYCIFALTMLAGCEASNQSDDDSMNVAANVDNPSKITMMTHTFSNVPGSVEIVQDEYKKITGIDLVINQIQGNDYYEKVNIDIAISNTADLIEVGSVFYPAYNMYDLLWDMTDTYESSSLKGKVDETFVNAMKIDDRLYGFPLSKGNGTITYIRKSWLEEAGLTEPKNYNEFLNMLRAFKQRGEDVIPMTAAGLINAEYPYSIYLPEFYQDANPDIYLKNGVYIDGMQEPQMIEALKRLKQAYEEGLIDPDISTNKTNVCRDKLAEGSIGCFNYWAGVWALTLNTNLKASVGETEEIIAIEPIAETKYIQRPPLALVIPKSCDYPEAVFKNILEFSMDGGQGQNLFTYGAEGINYTKNPNGTYQLIGQFGKLYYSSELNINNYKSLFPIENIIQSTNDMMEQNSIIKPLPITSKTSGDMLPELNAIRRETIEDIVTTDITIEEGMNEYQKRAGKMVERVLNDFNASLKVSEGE